LFFFFQAEDGIRDFHVTGVQTCALPICNVMFGNWNADDNGLVFSGVGGTLMFCEGVDTWLSTMQSATIQGNEMHILGEGGAEIRSEERRVGKEWRWRRREEEGERRTATR